ncbi:MAG: PQQ-like beta-propeller repeat protein [Acidobacteriota bacterium]|nr:PQQ-like beta-propeller repeat protein [Acidobacteriota bacterium]
MWLPLFLFSLVGVAPDEGDWTRFRGPAGDGVTTLFKAPASWSKQPKKVWEVPVGEGYGAPVVSGNRAYLLTGRDDHELITALDLASGKQLWQQRYPVSFKPNPYAPQYGNGPFATPLVSGNRLVTVGVTGIVRCHDTSSGKLLWQDDFGVPLDDDRTLFCGNTVSPVQVDDMVIVHLGAEKSGRMTAYNLADGKPRWTWDGDLPGYASPIPADIAGHNQLVALTQNSCNGLDPKTGKLLWSYPWKVQWRENIPNPVVIDGLVILSGRENGHTLGLEIRRNGDSWQTEEAWRNEEAVLYCASPVLAGNRLFGLSHKNKGQYFCLNAETGKLIWQSEGRRTTSAQPILAGAFVLFLDTEGKLLVLDKNADRYQPVATFKLAERATWAYPVPLAAGLLVKDKTHLTRWSFAGN